MSIEEVRAELAGFDTARCDGSLVGDFTAREIALVATLDEFCSHTPEQFDPLDNTAAIFGA